jgi:hypothetical protein
MNQTELIFKALEDEEFELATMLIEKGDFEIKETNENGENILAYAISKSAPKELINMIETKHIDDLKYLLNTKDKYGYTAYMEYVFGGYYDKIEEHIKNNLLDLNVKQHNILIILFEENARNWYLIRTLLCILNKEIIYYTFDCQISRLKSIIYDNIEEYNEFKYIKELIENTKDLKIMQEIIKKYNIKELLYDYSHCYDDDFITLKYVEMLKNEYNSRINKTEEELTCNYPHFLNNIVTLEDVKRANNKYKTYIKIREEELNTESKKENN